ncbi:MAG: M15 family metallopeptidase [Treponema sp.]|nr:M15 family metallopeptidase [Treponema sp.]
MLKLKIINITFLLCTAALCSGQGNSRERAEQVMKALAQAYPGRVEQAALRGGDWAVFLYGQWFYYAEGRLLPEELRSRAAEYDPQPFYNYQSELPPWKEPTPQEAERYRTMANNRNQNPPKRSQHFFDALWRARSKDESYQRVKSARFLGSSIMVHYSVLVDLALVEEKILDEAKKDPRVRAWVDGIRTMECWSWREIANTQSRSFHSYGAAIDILPKSTGGKESYWLWTARSKPEWWNIPYEQRLHPPPAVIRAFESRGFIWGGKWLYFDTMHFEYRPEILLLSGMPPLVSR